MQPALSSEDQTQRQLYSPRIPGRWVGLGVIADNLINIGRVMAK
jgi:hypothetical protein